MADYRNLPETFVREFDEFGKQFQSVEKLYSTILPFAIDIGLECEVKELVEIACRREGPGLLERLTPLCLMLPADKMLRDASHDRDIDEVSEKG